MTDRYKGFVVTLEENIRSDDAQVTISAIGRIKGVLSVKPVLGDVSTIMADERAIWKVKERLYDALRDLG